MARHEQTTIQPPTDHLTRIIDDFYTPGVINGHEYQTRLWTFTHAYPQAIAKARRQAGVHPVPINGSRTRGLKAGWFWTPLSDGTRGFYQRRTDDCLQAAIATILQLAPYRIPDLHINKQLESGKDVDEIEHTIWQRMHEWLTHQGLTLFLHPTPPTTNHRWIGVIPGAGAFADHALIMNGRHCLFDPAAPGLTHDEQTLYPVDRIDYGYTLET